MTSFPISQPLDANGRLFSGYGFLSECPKVLSANNTTAAVPIFRITGTIEVLAIWGIVTDTLGANNTAAHFRVNDQTAQPVITAASGVTLSAAGIGSLLVKITSAASAFTLRTSAAARFGETAANHINLQPFTITKKIAATTDIEFVYTTTDTPTTGAIDFFLRWLPMSDDADVVVV